MFPACRVQRALLLTIVCCCSQQPVIARWFRGREETLSSEVPLESPSPVPSSLPKEDSATSSPASHTNDTIALTIPTDDQDEDELYTIIVVSDVENKFRGHNIARSRFVIQYIRDLKYLDLYFDDEYSQYKIDPQLVINNGDVSHHWACNDAIFPFVAGSCRTPDEEFLDVWEQLYEASVPMISAYGNHDWRPKIGTGNPVRGTPRLERDKETDKINQWSSDFTYRTYEKAAAMGELEFEAIPPTGSIGQSMFRSTFRGLQIASFNAAYNWQSYDDNGVYDADDQFRRLAATLDRSQPTIFFSHFPLSSTRLGNQTPATEEAIALIQQFPTGVHHFSGHYHAAVVENYDGFNDYVAPYPHIWAGREPGYLAVLVSRKKGVVQVKSMIIPGLEDDTTCVPVNVIYMRDQLISSDRPFLHQRIDNMIGYRGEESGCDRCKAGQHYWSLIELSWVCGDVISRNIQELSEERTDAQSEFKDSLDENPLEDDDYY